MKILVTGGAGFIGSHTVVELYNAGHEAIILDNFSNSDKTVLDGITQILGFPVKYYDGDCNDGAKLEHILLHEKIEGVIHFAAFKAVGESVEKPLEYYTNNVLSTIILLKAMIKTDVKNLVFSSSCTVYGQPQSISVSETMPRLPATSPYGNTKVVCEDIIKETVLSKALISAISLRYFNPIGAHPSGLIGELPIGIPNNLVPFITQTAAGIREQLTIYGNDYDTSDGTCVRDFIHVVDLAKAHISALEFLKEQPLLPFYDIFNVGTGKGNTVLELIDIFEKVNSKKLNVLFGQRREGDIEKIYGDVKKIQEILGWKAQKTLEESLEDAWRWQLNLGKRGN